MTAITSVDICRCVRIPMSSHARVTSCFVAMRVDNGARAMLRRELGDGRVELGARHHPVDQPHVERLVGGERLRGVEVLVGCASSS